MPNFKGIICYNGTLCGFNKNYFLKKQMNIFKRN